MDIDYTLFYHEGVLILELLDGGSVPSTATTLTVGFDEVDPSLVTESDIIGGYDIGTRRRSGLELIEDVFPKFGITPDIFLCPNWSSNQDVAAVMSRKASGYNGIFKGKALIDVNTNVVKSPDEVVDWKEANRIDSFRQVLCFPCVQRGGRVYRLSTQMAGLMAQVDTQNGGCPNESPSNKPLQIDGTCLADGSELRLTLEEANYLNKNAVTTGLNFTGRFVLWGNYTAAFGQTQDQNEYFMYASRLFDWVGNLETRMTAAETNITNHGSRITALEGRYMSGTFRPRLYIGLEQEISTSGSGEYRKEGDIVTFTLNLRVTATPSGGSLGSQTATIQGIPYVGTTHAMLRTVNTVTTTDFFPENCYYWRLRDRDYLTSVTQNQHSFVPGISGADQIRSGMEMHLSGTFIVHG
ncbi:MAG: hypothetical protein FWG33_01420 [Oscillospiraceae bacterium]|nr:hypothetical protein [Oscillospiraceae bacterium]